MITINLLPQPKRAKVSDKARIIFVAVLGLVVVGGLLAGSYWYFDVQVQALQQAVQERSQTKKLLLAQIGKANQYVDELKAIEQRIQVIKEVRMRQGLPVRFLDALVATMPPERLWFESLSLGAGGQMNLSGVALDNQAFAAYVEALRQSPFIARVDIQRTSRRDVQGRGLVAFVCSVVGKDPGVEASVSKDGTHG
ncbi:MAG: Fimbrial assembly family protein [Desulfomicrobiaceae bacterium]|jgi:type IV pilus assembly protein PilN|nr:Fimbrial assembly family protein [Desulfomicrobiaceae bacterium]